MSANRRPDPDNRRLLLLNGPNLNLLGERDTATYGTTTLEEIFRNVRDRAERYGLAVTSYQSNHEGELIDRIHLHATGDPAAPDKVCGIIFNAGAYSHTSYAIRDALAAAFAPCVEVHLSNIHAREEFRHKSVLSAVCRGVIVGFGAHGYELAVQSFAADLELTERAR